VHILPRKEGKKIMNDSLRHSNLVEMLKTFSKDELKEFDKFVRSPFHNNRNEVTSFWSELKKYHPSFEQKDFTREKLFAKLHPPACGTGRKEKFRDDVISRLSSYLKSVIENYLSYKHFSENAFEKKLTLAKSLNEKNLDKLVEKQFKLCEETLDSNEGLDSTHLLNRYRLNSQKQEFYIGRKKTNSVIKTTMVVFESFINSFVSDLFPILTNITLVEREYNVKYNSELYAAFMNSFNAAQLLNKMKNNTDDTNILLLAVYHAYLVVQNFEDEGLRSELKELLEKYSDRFERETIRYLYNYLLNAYNYYARAGNSRHYRERLEIYKDLLSKNLLIDPKEEYLDREHLINITIFAVRLKEFDWAESFIEENIEKANPGERSDIYNYCKAIIAYHRKEYDTALSFIMKITFNVRKFYPKFLLCQIYYDMDYTEQLFSFIDSYRHYLNTDKGVPKDIKRNELSFLSYLNKLVKIKCNNDYKGLPVLKKNTLENKIQNREWLLEKIEELEKKGK